MPKKSNTKRADGRIAVQVYIGTVNGKRKYKTVYGKTQKEATEKANEIKVLLKKGVDVSSINDSFGAWVDYWLAAKKNKVSESYYKSSASHLKYFTDTLGNVAINKIKPLDIQNLINQLEICNPATQKPSAKKTLKEYLQKISAVFEFAIDNRVLDFNPCRNIDITKTAPKSERRSLTAEEIKRVEEFQHRAQLPAMLMLYSGLRRGEASALLWSDIDLKNKTITVNKSINFTNNELKLPKTKAGIRTVYIPQKLVDYLKKVKHKGLYVIQTASGKPMTATAWRSLWSSYMTDMNIYYGYHRIDPFTKKAISKYNPMKLPMLIEEFTPHCLRHTFCTMMYEAGIDVLVAQAQMGHTDVKTTLGIYTHLDRKHKEISISALDDYISKNENASQMQVINFEKP